MSDDATKPPKPDTARPPAPADLPSVVPRTPEEGLHAALDALRPSLLPAEHGARSAPPPLPARGHAASSQPAAPKDSAAPSPAKGPSPAPSGSASEHPAVQAGAVPPAPGLRALQPAALQDRGAWTAYRALPRRTPPDLARPEHVFGAPGMLARAELLEHLAARAEPEARSGLIVAAAEAHARAGQDAHARALCERAYTQGVRDPMLLRELRKYALAERDVSRAAELLRLEAALPLAAEERAYVLSLLAEVECALGDTGAAERTAVQADEDRPGLGAALALYALHAEQGRDREAAEQLQRAAQAWPDAGAQGGLMLLAARLSLRAGEPQAARSLCERAHDAAPSTLDALWCWARSSRTRADTPGALAALERLERHLPNAELRAHALRARARLVASEGNADLALNWLQQAKDLAGLRLRARLAEAQGDAGALRSALERRAEIAGGAERALSLLELAELQLGQREFEAAQRSLERAAATDANSLLVRTMQAALARARGGAGASASMPPDGNDAELLEHAARLGLDVNAAEQELSILDALAPARGTAGVIALDAAAELGRWDAVRAALEREAQRLSGKERAGMGLICEEMTARPPSANAAAPDQTPREPGSTLAWLHDAYAARDEIGAGEAWLSLSAHAGDALAACAATLAGDYLARAGRAREAYERALAAAPGHAPACHALEPILLEREDRNAARRLHAALARNARDPLERAARLLRVAQLADEDGAAEAWATACKELSAISALDALSCDRTLSAPAEPARTALADALEGAGHGGTGALADLAGLRAAAIYERAGEPARAAVLYREICDRRAGHGAHAAIGVERALAEAGLAALLVEHLERAQTEAPDPDAQLETRERLALLHAAAGDDLRAARAFRALQILEPGHLPALRAVQRHAMREGDLGGLAAVSEKLAARTRDPRERAAQLRVAARALGLRGERLEIATRADRVELGPWYAIEQERDARKRGDADETARAVLELAGTLAEADERASYAMRAAEALERVSPTDAAAALAPHAAAAPDHPLAYEALARLRHAAGDPAQAAADFERAAAAAPGPARAARLQYRAAVLWQDAVLDTRRARVALEAVMRVDPSYRDAFARLRRLLSAAGDVSALAALLQARAATGGEPGELAALYVERSRHLLQLGREPDARAALGLALECAPQHEAALRAAAELDMLAGRHRQAAETLIQLARVSRDPRVLRDAFFDLGRIYSEHLPDLRRAEIAYGRAVGLDGGDVEAIEHLMQVFRDKREHEKALRACQRLIDLERDDDQIDRRSVELASILEDMGDARRAERALNTRREQSPAAVSVLSALCDLYARQNDGVALAVHLDRSAHALRTALQARPGDAARFAALCDVLARRGRTDAAASVASFACDLGLGDARAVQLSAQRRGLDAAVDPNAIERLWPEALTPAARTLVRWLEPFTDALFGAPRVTRIEQPSAALRDAIESAKRALGMAKLDVVIASERGCAALRREPCLVGIHGKLLERCGAEELEFLICRAAATAQLGLLAATRSDPEDLAALIAAARSLDLPAEEAPDDDPKRAALRTRLAQQLSAKHRAELQAMAKQLPHDDLPLRALALAAGARVAFTATRALGPALRALSACASTQTAADYEAHDLLQLLERDPDAQDVLQFALSDAFLDLQRRARDSARPGEG